VAKLAFVGLGLGFPYRPSYRRLQGGQYCHVGVVDSRTTKGYFHVCSRLLRYALRLGLRLVSFLLASVLFDC
jgi:hypothetical protein